MNNHPWQEVEELEVELDDAFDKLIGLALVILVVTVCSAFGFGWLLLVRGLM